MITIGDILLPKHILPDLGSEPTERAIAKLTELLDKDPRVVDWDRLSAGLPEGTSCITKENGSTLCIAHARTNAVNAMVMAAGRSVERLPAVGEGGDTTRIRLIFVIGVPAALASNYLRIIGALARIFRTENGEAELAAAASAEEFLERLCTLEMEI